MIKLILILRRVIFIILLTLLNHQFLLIAQTNRSFSKKEYHAASQNWSVDFDNNGYAYFCNSTALLQFDGVTWKSYPSPNSTIIRAVAIDKNDRIYTGGYRELGYWENNENNELIYSSLTHLIEKQFTNNEEFWSIFITDESVIFHSFSKIYIYKDDTFSIIQPGGFINFATKVNNTVYVAILNQGIYRLNNQQLTPLITDDFLKNKLIRFLAHDRELNVYYVGTESDGLFSYNEETKEIEITRPCIQPFLIKNQINKGIINHNGDFIIGTILDGVISFNKKGKVIFHYNKENGLQSNTVLGIGMDKLSNIWLALDNGIEFIPGSYDGKKRFFYSEELGAVYTAALFNNLLYIGTNQGLYTTQWNSKDENFELLDNTQGQIWDCNVIDNKLFVGHNSGTFMIEDNKMETISNYAGAYSITRHPQNPDILIQGTYNDLIVYKRTNGEWQFSNTIKGFNNLIRFVEFDHLGNLWASHNYRGVYKLRLNETLDSTISIRHYEIIDSKDKNIRNPKAFKVEGRIVITSGENMYTYDDLNDTIILYNDFNNKLGQFKSSHRIIPAGKHKYWFINKQGMACFDVRPDDISLLKMYPNAVFQDHLIPTHENVIQINDSSILVSMENGYALLNPHSKSEGDEVSNFIPVLREAKCDDGKKEIISLNVSEKSYSLPNRLNNVTFRYSFPIINGDPTQFQYKIDGLSDEWSVLTDEPIFEIRRIPPGEYTIMVRAINNWNKYSQTSELHFKINHPWYQSWQAITMYFILISFLFGLSRRITTRKIKLKERRKREEKEKELIKLRNEKLRDELSHKSQQLAGSTMGIIKKNEFLMSLKAKIKKQKDALGTRYPDKYYQELINKIDENISGQDDWHIFEANFEQAHETFLKTLKANYPELTPSDLRLSAYLRINLTSKDIAPLLGISVRGVENHRYRLRKKLGLEGDENLVDFIINV
nr:triple tyrosine motif-containing protein [uncultured Carboxylicivirga sp.]